MPQIELTEATFKRLQKLARPLVDTASSVVEKLLDHYEDTADDAAASPPASKTRTRKFSPADAPPLTHTKLRQATFAGKELPRPNWAELVRTALEAGHRRTGSFEALQKMTDAHIVKGTKTDEGFSPLGNLGFSVQGVDAQDAWHIAYGLARKLSVPIEVEFSWRDKEAAAFPGEQGELSWTPSS
jgi:hypothetical protein